MAKITAVVEDDYAESLKAYIEGHVGVESVQLEEEPSEDVKPKSAMIERPEEEPESEEKEEPETEEEPAEEESSTDEDTPTEEKPESTEEAAEEEETAEE